MNPLLSQVYQSLLRLEELAGVGLSFRETVQEEIADDGKSYSIDLANFNRLTSELDAQPLGLEQTLASLTKIRLLSLALEDEFRNLSDAIAKAASEVTRHGA